MRDKAMTDRHCTVEEAVGVSRRMGAAYTVLTHFSSRFEKCMPDLSTYPGAETAQIGCAVDSMEVPVSRLGALKRVSRAACALLAAEYDLEEED
jgi:ribonuclease Z